MHQYTIQVGPCLISPTPNGFDVVLHPFIHSALETRPYWRGSVDLVVHNLKTALDCSGTHIGPELAQMIAIDSLQVEQALNRPFKVLCVFFGVLS